MKVSVIVATFGRDELLNRALASLSKQTHRDLEIVVVDDNEDASVSLRVDELLNDFRAGHSGLPVVCVKNGCRLGSARARNAGIAVATGEYITFLDDDDEYLPEKIEAQVRFMSEGHLDYSLTDLELYHEDGTLAERRVRSYIKKTDPESLLTYHLLHHLTGTDTLMFTSDYLRSINGFPPHDMGDEFYLMQRAIEKGGRFGYLPRCDVRATEHREDGGLSSGPRKIEGECQLYEHKKAYFDRLSGRSVRYIKMRHYAVLAFAYGRRKKVGRLLLCGACAFLTSPVGCVGLLKQRLSR